eukprot:g5735.t1
MKLNISNPAIGSQLCLDIDDEKKLRAFYDKRMGQEVMGEDVSEEFNGYVFRITGGNDKQGFPMKQGVLTNGRVRLLLEANQSCYRARRKGERKRKSVRGCIVGSDLSVLNLKVMEVGAKPIEGLTNDESGTPVRLGPKRANKIRKLFALSKEDDVRKYVVSRTFEKKGKKVVKRPKIQRLVTPLTLQRKRAKLVAKKKARKKAIDEAAAYKRLLAQRNKERRASEAARRSSRKRSRMSKKVSA